jgi:hypothetical protein
MTSGKSRQGWARPGSARHGRARHGRARRGWAGQARTDSVLFVLDEFYQAMTGRSMMRYPTGGKRGDSDDRAPGLVGRVAPPPKPAVDGLTRIPGCG